MFDVIGVHHQQDTVGATDARDLVQDTLEAQALMYGDWLSTVEHRVEVFEGDNAWSSHAIPFLHELPIGQRIEVELVEGDTQDLSGGTRQTRLSGTARTVRHHTGTPWDTVILIPLTLRKPVAQSSQHLVDVIIKEEATQRIFPLLVLDVAMGLVHEGLRYARVYLLPVGMASLGNRGVGLALGAAPRAATGATLPIVASVARSTNDLIDVEVPLAIYGLGGKFLVEFDGRFDQALRVAEMPQTHQGHTLTRGADKERAEIGSPYASGWRNLEWDVRSEARVVDRTVDADEGSQT